MLALRAHRHATSEVQRGVTPGWRNVVSADPLVRLATADGTVLDVSYRVRGDEVRVGLDAGPLGPPVGAEVTAAPDGYRVALERDRVRRTFHVAVAEPYLDVSSSRGGLDLRVVDPLPAPDGSEVAGSLVAPMPGVVVRTEVAAGDPVTAGQPLLVLEAMKMEHVVRAPQDGRVRSLLVAAGDQVDAGQPLVVLDAAPGGGEP